MTSSETITRAYQAELKPNDKQRGLFHRYAGAARYVYNWGLAEWKEWYERGDKPSHYRLCKSFNARKDEVCPWIREIPYAVTESAFRNLGAAFQHFFRRVKNAEAEKGYPRFKKRGHHNSFQLRNTRIERDRVRLTGIGWVRLKERSYLPLSASGARFGTYATISERAGRWYISVSAEESAPMTTMPQPIVLGVDFGINKRAVSSDGTIYEAPNALRDTERKLARLNRELARRTKGGANWYKTKTKLAKAHAHVANIRQHWLHEISHDLVVNKRPAAIVVEDLNVSGMVQNRHLAKAVSDASFGELRRQIEYKGQWYGTEVLIADRWYPSSKTCSGCGCVIDGLPLSDRVYHCEHCGLEIDRDWNAARNLAALVEKAETRPDCLGS